MGKDLKLSSKAMNIIENNPGIKYMYQEYRKSMSLPNLPEYEDNDDDEYELVWNESMTALVRRKKKKE